MILLSNNSASMSYEKRQSADEERKLERDVELSRKYNVSINYEEKRNMDEEPELERDAGLLKEKGASIGSEERQNNKGR